MINLSLKTILKYKCRYKNNLYVDMRMTKNETQNFILTNKLL